MVQTTKQRFTTNSKKSNSNTKAKRKTKSIYYCVFTKYIKVSSSHHIQMDVISTDAIPETTNTLKMMTVFVFVPWNRTPKKQTKIVHIFVSNKQSAKMCHDEKQWINGAGNHFV